MVKIGFKLFGCFSVFLFFLIGGISIAVSTLPPVYSVRPEIKENVYPAAREHAKDNLMYFREQTLEGRDLGEMKFSEIELNAFLHLLCSEKFLPGGDQFIKDQYLYLLPGTLKLRFDISIPDLVKFISARASGNDLTKAVDAVAKSNRNRRGKKSDSKLAITILMKVFWIEKDERPYFYLDRVYLGVLPLPIPVLLSDYQDQFNTFVETSFHTVIQYSPVYFRRIDVKDKNIVIKTEIKMTEGVALKHKMNEFDEQNPVLARALDSRNCLYGCTEEERVELDTWMDKIGENGANDVSSEDVIFFKMVKNTMTDRKKMQIQNIHKTIDWKRIKEYSPQDKDWQFKNWPEAEK